METGKMKSDSRKRNSIFLFLAMGITVALLFSACNNNIEYMRIGGEKSRNDITWYNENILVRNTPRNDFEQSKMMIAYFDSTVLSTIDISKMHWGKYYMWFYESTYASRKYFLEAGKYWAKKENIPAGLDKEFYFDESEVYLGNVHIFRCDSDTAKWMIGFKKK